MSRKRVSPRNPFSVRYSTDLVLLPNQTTILSFISSVVNSDTIAVIARGVWDNQAEKDP